ncbi:hypothetical protein ABID65_009621 [Bradyrhizobium sp. S3.9.2]
MLKETSIALPINMIGKRWDLAAVPTCGLTFTGLGFMASEDLMRIAAAGKGCVEFG